MSDLEAGILHMAPALAYGCMRTRVVCAQVKDRDDRLVKAEALLRSTLAAKDQELEAAKVWQTEHWTPFYVYALLVAVLWHAR